MAEGERDAEGGAGVLNFRLAPATDNRQAYVGMTPERLEMALMAHLGLWDAASIARAYGTTRHSVYRAKNHFKVVPRG